MKKQTGIWLDSKRAILVQLVNGEHSFEKVDSDIENRIYHNKESDKGSFMQGTHSSNEKSFDEREKQQRKNFVNELFEMVKISDEILVFGPSEMKKMLKKRIEEDQNVASKLKSVETAQAMTENQLVSYVKSFFEV